MPTERHRQGLVENAGGELTCPRSDCREPITIFSLVHVATPLAETMVLPHHSDVTPNTAAGQDISSITRLVVGLMCSAEHTSYLQMRTEEGRCTVTTEWDEPDEQ